MEEMNSNSLTSLNDEVLMFMHFSRVFGDCADVSGQVSWLYLYEMLMITVITELLSEKALKCT
jgi:hypothetical protein